MFFVATLGVASPPLTIVTVVQVVPSHPVMIVGLSLSGNPLDALYLWDPIGIFIIIIIIIILLLSLVLVL